EPINALPKPIHVAAVPNLPPKCPAYPTKNTPEKKDVSLAEAGRHGTTARPPTTKTITLDVFFFK
ncbi:hypothetical protein, partial [Treponema sp. R6D11]